MIFIKKLENRFVVLILHLLIIGIISYLDYITGPELSFSFFYLIPIASLSLYKNTTVLSVLIASVLASIFWFLAEYVTRDYSIIFYPIWNAFVRLTIFTAVGLLVFYLKEKQKKLNELNDKLKAINEEKNKFIGITAHDIRNPLSGIYSFSDLLIVHHNDNVSPKVLEILTHIRTISSNTLIVLKNLLNISTIESGKVELNKTKQDYILFVKNQISINQIIARNKNIDISFQTSIDSIMAEFDNHYLSEVLDNLVSNAIKYSFNGSEIFVKVSKNENEQIQTEVIDNGNGIPAEEQQKLFTYFQTTSSRPTNGEQSTGLGLAIAKQIVILHDGQIGLKSNVKKGSNFYFTLPIK